MAKITLKKLELSNFKGQKSLSINFNETETQVFGRNRAGKTTIFDAFLWLLFGKDSQDRKDFAVKPLNEEGSTTDKTETEVIGVFDFDGNETTLRRVLTEKWQKKRGSTELEFTGNETKFYWNDVPFSATEYSVAIKSRIDENLFKLLTNPARFNELGWQERRQILFSIVDIGSDKEIAASINHPDITDFVIGILNSDKTLKQYKAELLEKKKKIKDELGQITPRIAENNRLMPVTIQSEAELVKALNKLKERYNDVQAQIESETKQIEKTNEAQTLAKSKILAEINRVESELQKKAHELTLYANKAVNDHALQVQALESELKQIEQEKQSKQRLLEGKNKAVAHSESVLIAYRAELAKENEKVFSYSQAESNCPTCKQSLPAEVVDVDAMRANFNKEKLANIERIQSLGIKEKASKTEAESEAQILADMIGETTGTIQSKTAELELLRASAPTPGAVDLSALESFNAEIARLRADLAKLDQSVISNQTESLKEIRTQIQAEIDTLSKEYQKYAQIEQIKLRVDELLEQEKTLANSLSEYEKQEFLIDEFNSIKIKQVEQKINSMFSYVNFKMFNTLINGGVEECCEALINGVPYSDANTGSKINAGLDIINVLSNYYSTSAPCFIDNAESVTGFIDFQNQIIKLIVSAEDKDLRVN